MHGTLFYVIGNLVKGLSSDENVGNIKNIIPRNTKKSCYRTENKTPNEIYLSETQKC